MRWAWIGRVLIPGLIAAVILVLGAQQAWRDLSSAAECGFPCAGEARGIYLPCVALRQGLDPTSAVDLHGVFLEQRALNDQVHNWPDPLEHVSGPEALPSDPRAKHYPHASMYPVTASVLLGPFCGSGLPAFVHWWRPLVFWTFLAGVVAAGAAGARGSWAPLGAGLALWIGLLSPMVHKCSIAGQANLLVGGVFGLCLAALAFRQRWLAAVLAVLGASVKLVPALALWPLVCARSWRALIAGAVVALALLIAVASQIPLWVFLRDLLGIVSLHSGMQSTFAMSPDPLLRTVEIFRGPPLMLATFALTGVLAWSVAPDPGKRPEVLASAAALAVCWLGISASATTVGYAALGVPAACFLATWPLRRGAPWFSLVAVPLALAALLLYPHSPMRVVELGSLEVGVVLGSLAAWLGLVGRLFWAGRSLLNRWYAVGVGAWLLLSALWVWFQLSQPVPVPPG